MGIQRGVHSSMPFWDPSNILERSSRNVNVEGFEFEYLKGHGCGLCMSCVQSHSMVVNVACLQRTIS